MENLEKLPPDPVSLAAPTAETIVIPEINMSLPRKEQLKFLGLDAVADSLGFVGQKYFVESRRSLSIPASFEAQKPVELIDFMGLTFEGKFVTYSQVTVGKIIGAHSVRALCLSFDDVTLLPYFDHLPEDHLLHVPVLAVESISGQAA